MQVHRQQTPVPSHCIHCRNAAEARTEKEKTTKNKNTPERFVFHRASLRDWRPANGWHFLHAAEASSQQGESRRHREDQSDKKFLDATMLLLLLFSPVTVMAQQPRYSHALKVRSKELGQVKSYHQASIFFGGGSGCISADTAQPPHRRYDLKDGHFKHCRR